MAGFREHDDNDDAVTATNVEGRLSIMTIMFGVVWVFDYLMTLLDVQNLLLHRTKRHTNVTNGECINTGKQATVPSLGLILQDSLGEGGRDE